MNWKAKHKAPKPQLGDMKQKIKFAVFPTHVEDQIIWFEKYIQIYEYKEYFYEYDVVVSEGLLTEKYYTDIRRAEGWKKTERKLIPFTIT